MNPGNLAGFGTGTPGATRLIGRIGKQTTYTSSARAAIYAPSAYAPAGLLANLVSFTNGVTQRVVSVTGCGALKLLTVGDNTTSANDWAVRVLIDGELAISASWTHTTTAGYGPAICGNGDGGSGSGSAPIWLSADHIPFARSLEIYVTGTGAGVGAAYVPYLIDLYA